MAAPISINNQQLGLRLLELPSELVELLESSDSPVLQLKSSNPSSTLQTPANVVLCTSNRSFEVRQVQSSNVLYILQRSAESGFTAISQCKGVLELVPSKANAIEYIRQTLPRYTEDRTSQSNITRSLLSADAPFSEGELGNALTKLCVLQKDDLLWIPEPKALLTAWKSLLTVATINGVQLDHPWNIRELEHHVAEDGIDIEIFYAIVSRLTNRPQDVCEAALDACNCIVWIGRLVLDCKDKPIPKNEFVTEWQDLLLEPWRSGARLDLMKGEYMLLDDGSIMTTSHSAAELAAPKPVIPPKSKWHQKFRK